MRACVPFGAGAVWVRSGRLLGGPVSAGGAAKGVAAVGGTAANGGLLRHHVDPQHPSSVPPQPA